MAKIFKLVLLLGVIALGWWLWTVMFPKPEQVIRNRLNKLAKLASFSPHQGNISRVANIEKMGSMFDENVQVSLEISAGDERNVNFTRRDELKQAALAAQRFASGLKAEFLDMSIQVAPDEQSAVADLMLQAKVAEENDLIVQELKFTFKNAAGDWLITRIETVKSLKH